LSELNGGRNAEVGFNEDPLEVLQIVRVEAADQRTHIR
jgi:hypothetical protein